MIDIVIKTLQEHYAKTQEGKSMDYTYGYMDALAILKEIAKCVKVFEE